MGTPQKGKFIEGTTSFVYMKYKLNFSIDNSRLKDALANIIQLNNDNMNVVISFGSKAWDWINPDWAPVDFYDYIEVKSDSDYGMPATQRDLFFWINSDKKNSNFDVARAIQKTLKDVATLELEQEGFRYHDFRDLSGFIDGSENPKDDERYGIACVAEGKPGAGGSHVFIQKWIHDLEAFLAFAFDPCRTQIQLERMTGTIEDKIHDKLMEYSKPVTGSYWFAPTVENLNEMLN